MRANKFNRNRSSLVLSLFLSFVQMDVSWRDTKSWQKDQTRLGLPQLALSSRSLLLSLSLSLSCYFSLHSDQHQSKTDRQQQPKTQQPLLNYEFEKALHALKTSFTTTTETCKQQIQFASIWPNIRLGITIITCKPN